eukprot:CAMPEP_0196166626 /NCGR_PEP_ID=MMETSP0911-20130528/2085_1 /TAXON_ID=49265 /ORGANISM="Thalassiosira rotula, Strain GSO102" /LENGTH=32 /DNA_ID= /DNA_START= /DNA_END= /DNA_ORIENTATION=
MAWFNVTSSPLASGVLSESLGTLVSDTVGFAT